MARNLSVPAPARYDGSHGRPNPCNAGSERVGAGVQSGSPVETTPRHTGRVVALPPASARLGLLLGQGRALGLEPRRRRSRQASTSASTSRRWVITGGAVGPWAGCDGRDARVEVVDLAADLALGGDPVEAVVELGVLLAEREGRREDAGDLLALDQLLQPPVGVVLAAQALDRLARAGQVVELAALLRAPDLLLDPAGLVVDPGRGGRPARALVALGRSPGVACCSSFMSPR